MATPSPDSKNWAQLAAAARCVPAPALDVRIAVRAALAATVPSVLNPPASGWVEALLQLAEWPGLRVLLAGGCTAALVLCFFGWQGLAQTLSDPFVVAAQTEVSELLPTFTP